MKLIEIHLMKGLFESDFYLDIDAFIIFSIV